MSSRPKTSGSKPLSSVGAAATKLNRDGESKTGGSKPAQSSKPIGTALNRDSDVGPTRASTKGSPGTMLSRDQEKASSTKQISSPPKTSSTSTKPGSSKPLSFLTKDKNEAAGSRTPSTALDRDINKKATAPSKAGHTKLDRDPKAPQTPAKPSTPAKEKEKAGDLPKKPSITNTPIKKEPTAALKKGLSNLTGSASLLLKRLKETPSSSSHPAPPKEALAALEAEAAAEAKESEIALQNPKSVRYVAPPPSVAAPEKMKSMLERQTRIESLPPKERREQESWAQEQLQLYGRCPAGFLWFREEGWGYRCAAGGHRVSDGELVELVRDPEGFWRRYGGGGGMYGGYLYRGGYGGSYGYDSYGGWR